MSTVRIKKVYISRKTWVSDPFPHTKKTLEEHASRSGALRKYHPLQETYIAIHNQVRRTRSTIVGDSCLIAAFSVGIGHFNHMSLWWRCGIAI